MEAFSPLVLIVMVGVIFVTVLAFQRRRWRRRREAWHQVGLRLGYVDLEPDRPPMAEIAAFELFSRGHSQKLRCGVKGETWSGQVVVADSQFTTGSGRNSRTHRQTVCILRKPDVDLPRFLLRPERPILDRIVEIFGFTKDIDFDDDPEFSRAFLLKGDDEAAVRALFTPAVRMVLRNQEEPIPHLEGGGDAILFSSGRLIEPAQCDALMQRTTDFFRLFTGA